MLRGINRDESGMFRLGYSTGLFQERDHCQAYIWILVL